MTDEVNPNGSGPVDPGQQFTPEQEAAMAAARAQAEAMIRDVVTPMIEGSNKAIVAEMRKAISELGAAIPEAVDKCLAQRIAEAKAQAGTAQVEQPQSAGTTEKAVVATGGDNRMGQIAGLFQLLGPMVGIGPANMNDPLALMERFFGINAKLNELVAAQNNQLIQGVQLASTVMRGAVSAGTDPDEAAKALGEAFKPKAKPAPTAQDAASQVKFK